MVRTHRRFELLDVTLDEEPIGRCTIDAWEDDNGIAQWTARVLMKAGHESPNGRLIGRTREGRWLSGPVRFAGDQLGPGGGRMVLGELHGQGTLADVPADEVATIEAAKAEAAKVAAAKIEAAKNEAAKS